MEQVFINLLENAARYTPAGTRIDITAQRDGTQALIRVADNGPGLPAGTEARVFDKFFRGLTTPTADGRRGAGLGLAICKAIIQAHGGQISARNLPSGVEFLIALPCEGSAPRVALDEMPARGVPVKGGA
jgi:two-component system sensor histidine kinase KdpD